MHQLDNKVFYSGKCLYRTGSKRENQAEIPVQIFKEQVKEGTVNRITLLYKNTSDSEEKLSNTDLL